MKPDCPTGKLPKLVPRMQREEGLALLVVPGTDIHRRSGRCPLGYSEGEILPVQFGIGKRHTEGPVCSTKPLQLLASSRSPLRGKSHQLKFLDWVLGPTS